MDDVPKTSWVHSLAKRLDIDDRLGRARFRRYLLQCSLASIVVLIIILLLDVVTQTVLIAALGSSTFIAFAVPKSLHSGPRHLVGGYIVGIIAGCLMAGVYRFFHFTDPQVLHIVMVACGALATGLAMLAMVVTRTEHPPAAALAMGLVFNEWDATTILVVLAGIVVLSIFKQLVMPYLMDLL